MANGYTRSPRLLKGALIEVSESFIGPVLKEIAFQYNPETISRELTPWSADVGKGGRWGKEDPSAQPFDPGEKFTLALELDATDALEDPDNHPIAVVSGVADRLAALEMLLYPLSSSLLGDVLGQLGRAFEKVPRGSVPIVLLMWGPGRIVPVRLTSFSVEEQAFSPTLYPIQAKVSVGLQVLTPESFQKPKKKLSASEKLAIAAYEFSRGQKKALANSTEILGMLPF